MKNFIKYISIIVFLTLSYGCNTDERNNIQSTYDSDVEILIHLKETQWPKAYAEQDTVLLDRILGDDFQMIDHAGNWYTKQVEIDWIKKNAAGYDSFHFEIKRFDLLDNGTAIICGTGHILQDSVKSIYQSSNVLVKRNGEWKGVLSHVSGIKNIDD